MTLLKKSLYQTAPNPWTYSGPVHKEQLGTCHQSKAREKICRESTVPALLPRAWLPEANCPTLDRRLSTISLSFWRTVNKCMNWSQMYTSAVNSQQIFETGFLLLVIKSLNVKGLFIQTVLSTSQFYFSNGEKHVLKPQDLMKLTNYHPSERNSQQRHDL